MVVEDERDILELLAELLEDHGHHVTAVADGAKAMRWLDRRRFDVAICDVRLPHVDGMTIFHRIRQDSPATDVILMSAYGSVAEAVVAMKQDATHYLAKPFEAHVLLELVDRIAEQRRLETKFVAARHTGTSTLIGDSPAMSRVRDVIASIAPAESSVLLTGESGTGKELAAREIHNASPRTHRPFVAVNCAAFPETLLEAELFGHERGAFTGAHSRREGRFWSANGGTLFLDELGEMSLSAQAKLLRVLETGRYERLGSNQPLTLDVRLISATNADIREAVMQGRLREDIYHRLKVFHLHLPPLRDRKSDLAMLVRHFYERFATGRNEVPPPRTTPRAWAALAHYPYPGNVRELKHIVEHAAVLSGGEAIDLQHLPRELRGEPTERDEETMESLANATAEFEREYLLRALRRCEWHRERTAAMLQISRKTLWTKLKVHDIDGP